MNTFEANNGPFCYELSSIQLYLPPFEEDAIVCLDSRKFAPQKSLGKVQQQKGSETGVTIIPTRGKIRISKMGKPHKSNSGTAIFVNFELLKYGILFGIKFKTVGLGFVHSHKISKVSRILHVS